MCIICNNKCRSKKEALSIGIALGVLSVAYALDLPLCAECSTILAEDALQIREGLKDELEAQKAEEAEALVVVNNYQPTGSDN